MTKGALMICNSCQQNEASIHLTEIVNNQMIEIHLCESCADQKGTDFKTHFDFNKLLASLADFGSALKAEPEHKLVCKSCGITSDEFGKTGRLGCPECFTAFEKLLLPLLKRVQRETQHVGKAPKGVGGDAKRRLTLRDLQLQLKKSIEREDLFNANEVFLTGTAAEVIPVVKIDGGHIGTGKPGKVTRKLMSAFRDLTKRDGVRYSL